MYVRSFTFVASAVLFYACSPSVELPTVAGSGGALLGHSAGASSQGSGGSSGGTAAVVMVSGGGEVESNSTGGATPDDTGITPAGTGAMPSEMGGATSAKDPTVGTGGSAQPSASFTTSSELMASLDLGWNLGNSLDAPEGETAWGNPEVNPTLLQAVAASGFDIVRIPVTWSLHMGAGPEFTIEDAWFERVEEVVTYVLDAGMHAVVNVHHDGADNYEGVEWLTLNEASGVASEQNNQAVAGQFEKVWQQIAARFQKYDERLLFESMNEIHDGYDAPPAGYHTTINELNQLFVDIVRRSGGNNTTRHLVVPGYNTNIDHTLAGFVAPNDPTPDHLTLSVHFYDPYLFALEASVHVWGNGEEGADDWGQEDHVVAQFDRLKTAYLDKGLPMIIGEYGAVHQVGFEDYRRYYMEYITLAAHERGIVPIYWDNGAEGSGKENLGLFARATGAVLHPAIVEAMQRAVGDGATLGGIAKPAR